MATTAQITIDVNDKSLVELNQEIKKLETSIQGLKSGTAEWVQQNQKLGGLKTRFADATREAQKLQNVVEKVSGAEQLRSVAKLGQGMVGAFGGVTNSIALLGGSNKAFDELTAKATTFMAVMSSMNAISETFSAENLKGLRAVGGQFKVLVNTVKASTLAIRGALIATGVGALVVGLGLLIANWDKLKAAVTSYRAEREKQKEVEELKKEVEVGKEKLDVYGKQIAAQKELAKLNADKISEYNAEKSFIIFKTDQLKKELEYVNQQSELLAMSKDRSKEYFDQQLLNARKSEEITANIKVLAAELKKINEIIAKQPLLDELDSAIARYGDLIKLKEAEGNSTIEIIELQKKSIQKLIEKNAIEAKINGEYDKATKTLTGQAKIREEGLKADIQALKIKEDNFVKTLTYTERIAKIERDRNNYQNKFAIETAEINAKIESGIKFDEKANIKIEKQKDLYDNISKGFTDYLDMRSQEANFQTKNLEGLKKERDYMELIPSSVMISRDAYQKISELTQSIGEDVTLFGDKLKENISVTKEELSKQIDLKGINLERYDAQVKQLAINRTILEFQNEINKSNLSAVRDSKLLLESKQSVLEKLRKNNESTIESYKLEVGVLEIAKNKAKNAEERKAIEDEIYGLQTNINSLYLENLSITSEINSNEESIRDYSREIDDLQEQQVNNSNAIAENTKKTTDELRVQETTQQKISDWAAKYAEEIQVSQQILSQSLEFIAALQDRKAAESQERIDGYNKQLDELTSKEEDRASNLLALEEELKDANGSRYDELLAQIELEKNANITAQADEQAKRDEINAKIKDEENKKLAAEARAAKWRKAQALIDAVIQGALGVIKALPNVFLAVATGVLAAAGIATIAAQKTPDIPKGYKVGGYTGNGNPDEVAGVTHKGEYVIPANVVSKPENHTVISNLEAQRLRGFKEGGLVPAVNSGASDYIDYDRLITGIAGALTAMPSPVVSVVEITNVQNKVALTKQQAGLTR